MSIESLLLMFERRDSIDRTLVVGPRDGVRPCYELRISGVGTRWYSGPRPAVVSPYTYEDGVLPPSSYDAKLDGFKGVVEAGGTRVSIRRTRGDSLANLLRIAPRGGGQTFTLAQSITSVPRSEAGDDFDLFVKGDISSMPSSGTLHIGLEAFKYTSKDDGAGSFAIDERGYLGSLIQAHIVYQFSAPQVTEYPTYWEGRPAEILMSAVAVDGRRHPDSFEFVAGFLDAAADEIEPGTLQLTIVPWAAAAERQIGGPQAVAHLQRGWAVFGPEDARRIRVLQEYDRGSAYFSEIDDALDDILTVRRSAQHDGAFDPSAVDARRGTLSLQRTEGDLLRYDLDDVDPYPAADQIRLSENLDGVVAGQLVGGGAFNAAARITRYAVVAADGSAAVIWPDAALASITRQFSPGTPKDADAPAGVDPSFVDIRLERHNNQIGGPALSCRATAPSPVRGPHLTLFPYDPGRLWYPIDFAEPDNENHPLPTRQQPRNSRQPIGSRRLRIDATADNQAQRSLIAIRGIADAFWQQGKWILVDSNPFPAPPFTARVTWDERGSPRSTLPLIVSVQLASEVFAGVPGYLLEVDENDRMNRIPFGDWNGQRTVEVSASINFINVTVGQAFLRMLTSVAGNGANGEYDVLPMGAGVPIDRIDVDSFLALSSRWGQIREQPIKDAKAVREIMLPMLHLLDLQLVELLELSTGRKLLTIQNASIATSRDVVPVKVGDRAWLMRSRPGTQRDRRTINAVTYKANFNAEGKATLEVPVVDQSLVNGAGGMRRTQTEELRGVQLPGDIASQRAQLESGARRRLSTYGHPRRLITGAIGLAHALRIAPGTVIRCVSTSTHDESGQLGVDENVRVTGVNLSPADGRAVITGLFQSLGGKGIAPALKVTSSTGAMSFICALHAYAPLRDRRNGADQTDLDLFRVGQKVWLVPKCDRANRVKVTITALDNGTGEVTVDGAHPFAAPNWGNVRILARNDPDIDERELEWAFFGGTPRTPYS